ncbi:MAG: Chromosome (plasmid) partitioning protein ParB [Candidatus Ozemobacter sibiricus]|uniref:Chromosome (Plasmid) partitioning protein ParB n=1 Tax=Candidatus Ozemobacter sibiricus TaxID=2268124 RepID=A0A367ZNS6_9BACT|nr:MAG: Chromosome (plasmid) partitioning protein ParB [Candidatus Ozemobacter sibiricus]
MFADPVPFNHDDRQPADSPREFQLLPIEQVVPNPRQPRRTFDQEKLRELAASIRQHGVIQPILVRRMGDGYQIISGERRYQACKLLGVSHIPAVLKETGDQEAMLASLIENIQREDLNPVEEAQAMREILLKYGLTHDQLAEKLGRSRSALTNRLRILQLPADIQKLIAEGTLSAGHAKILAGLRDPKAIRAWVKKVVRHELSVYETEKQIADARAVRPPARSTKGTGKMSADLHVAKVEASLQEVLGAKVRIRQGRTRGRIEIEFYDREDLERVVESLLGNRL